MKKPSQSRKEFLAYQAREEKLRREAMVKFIREEAASIAKKQKIQRNLEKQAERQCAGTPHVLLPKLPGSSSLLENPPIKDRHEAVKDDYTCPHCNREMNYVCEHRGLTSQCPHCQKGIVLGGELPLIPIERQTNNESWRDEFKTKIASKRITVIVSSVLLIVSLMATVIFSIIHKADLEEKRRQEISKKEAELAAKKEAEEEKYLATIDAQIAKMEADYNATFSVNGKPYVPPPPASVSDAPMTLEQIQARYNNMTDFQRDYFNHIVGKERGDYFDAARQYSRP